MLDRITIAFSALWTALVRTVVPTIVAAVVAFLTTRGLSVDDELKAALTGFVTVLFAAIYYVAIRLLERVTPKLGWLLGSTKQPVYAKPEAVTVVEQTARVANESVTK